MVGVSQPFNQLAAVEGQGLSVVFDSAVRRAVLALNVVELR